MDEVEYRQLLTVVVIDDDPNHLQLITRSVEWAFESDDRRVTAVGYHDPELALAELPAVGETVILLDYRLGEHTGLDWIADFVREDAGPVVMLTSVADVQVAAKAFRHGATDYLMKDRFLDAEASVAESINCAMRRFRIERTNRDLRQRLKAANRELASKNERLAELTETAHRFVDDVAHEFRTPLAVIKEFASIISDGLGGPISSEQQEYLAFIGDATRDLANLVDDFLDSGKLQARTLRVRRRDHTVAEVVAEAMPLLQSRARTREVQLTVDVPDDLDLVHVDAEKIRRVLVNLVVNALKFSSAGDEVVVFAEARPDPNDENAGEVRIGVRDQGPGLSPEELEHLFERFRQGVGASRIATRGFGLGLCIVQALVDINLGEIEVESQPGEGSTFAFTMPLATTESLLSGYLRGIGRRAGSARVTLYRMSRPGGPAEDPAELSQFLAGVSHAGDLQLPAADGAVHLLVETEEQTGWRNRLIAADVEHREERRHVGLEPLVIEECGSWPLRGAEAPLRAALGLAAEVHPHA